MFNIGFTELIILCVIGLLVVGPEQLPDLARKMARMLNDLKRAKDEIWKPVDEFKDQALRSIEKTRQQMHDQLNVDLHEKQNPHQHGSGATGAAMPESVAVQPASQTTSEVPAAEKPELDSNGKPRS